MEFGLQNLGQLKLPFSRDKNFIRFGVHSETQLGMVNGTWFYTKKIVFFHGKIRDGEFLSHKINGTGRFTHISLMFLIDVGTYTVTWMIYGIIHSEL